MLSELETAPEHNATESELQIADRLLAIEAALESIEAMLCEQKSVKEWYTVAEAAEVLDKAAFTVREWCRHGRVNAHKRPCGRGTSKEWILSHTELDRIRNKGLLPVGL